MSYVLRIDENAITKIPDAQFPGSETMEKPNDALVPKTPVLHEQPAPMRIPSLSLKAKPSEAVKESDDIQPMGTYGRMVKMPSLKLITKEASDIEPMGVYGHMVHMPSITLKLKQADSMSSMPALGREGGPGSGKHGNAGTGDKKTKLTNPNRLASISLKSPTVSKESFFTSRLMTRFMESVNGTETQDSPSRYQVTLISEGLGNLGDGFYYTANALQSGAPLFEGQKCYANHPSSVEEQVLPERSVRDIIGHFENVQCVQNGDHAEIQGELVVMGGPDYAWVQSQLDHALQFSQKYTDKDFVGLSINAGGQATPMDVQTFMATFPIPASCMPKLDTAMSDGLTQVKVVDQITEAVSCDLVTQAGAGGRIIQKI